MRARRYIFGGGRSQEILRVVVAGLVLLSLYSAPAFAFQTINRIKASGEIRIGQLAPASPTAAQERVLAEQMARGLDAKAVFIDFVGFDVMLEALADGRVDLVAEPLSQARPLPAGMDYSLPVRHSDLWLVTSPYVAQADSRTAPLAVHFASDAWHQALQLKRRDESIQLRVATAKDSRADLLRQVARGDHPASLAYSHEFTTGQFAGLRPRHRLRDEVALSWVLRDADRVLRKKVDDFLREHTLTREVLFVEHLDWPQIAQRGRIRLVTLYRPETYFAWSGQLLGFEFELARAFADSHGLALDIVIARDRRELLERLRSGEADFAAAFLTPQQLGEDLVATRPYFEATARVISRAGRFHRLGPMDLHLRSVLLDENSPYAARLSSLAAAGVGLDPRPRAANGAELIAAVARGEADFAVVDEHDFLLQSLWRDDVAGLMSLDTASPRVWAVRPDSPALKAKLDAYWEGGRAHRRERLARRKYFTASAAPDVLRDAARVFQRDRSFSLYDTTVRKYASYYAFDWRLILAIILQESRFDPNAVSRSGARGLMQVQDAASRQVGIADLFEPKSAIHAGVKYLDWVRNQFEPQLDIRDRTWFSLAAYNGGLTHVNAARALARKQGRDHRRWFGEVELAMADLPGDPRYRALDATQVTNYVRRIRHYYEMYVRLTEHQPDRPQQMAEASEPGPTVPSVIGATPLGAGAQ